MPSRRPTRPIASAARRRTRASPSASRRTRSGGGGGGTTTGACSPRCAPAAAGATGGARIAQQALILQPEDPRHLLFERGTTGVGGGASGALAHAAAASANAIAIVLRSIFRRHLGAPSAMISSAALQFRHIAIEGPIGAGKTALAERLGTRLDATVVLEETDNPFLADFYADRPGAALQAQLFYLLNRHRQQTALRQADLFSQITIADYLFDKDKIFAYLNLDDNELFIYQRLYDLLARDVPSPDLVVYLQAPTDVLLRRVHTRRRDPESVALQPDDDYLRELNEAYHHFFFHYNATPLLVVETSQFDSDGSDEARRRSDQADPQHGPRHAVLRAADESEPEPERSMPTGSWAWASP